MQNVFKALTVLSALAFILAVAAGLGLFSVSETMTPEALSRACTNLALLGIAFSMAFKES